MTPITHHLNNSSLKGTDKTKLKSIIQNKQCQPSKHHHHQIGGIAQHHPTKRIKGKNPQRNSQPTRCNICESINYSATQCPDRSSDDVTYMVHELVLQKSNTDLPTLTVLT